MRKIILTKIVPLIFILSAIYGCRDKNTEDENNSYRELLLTYGITGVDILPYGSQSYYYRVPNESYFIGLKNGCFWIAMCNDLTKEVLISAQEVEKFNPIITHNFPSSGIVRDSIKRMAIYPESGGVMYGNKACFALIYFSDIVFIRTIFCEDGKVVQTSDIYNPSFIKWYKGTVLMSKRPSYEDKNGTLYCCDMNGELLFTVYPNHVFISTYQLTPVNIYEGMAIYTEYSNLIYLKYSIKTGETIYSKTVEFSSLSIPDNAEMQTKKLLKQTDDILQYELTFKQADGKILIKIVEIDINTGNYQLI